MNKLFVCIASLFMISGLADSATAQPQYYNYTNGTSANSFPFNISGGKKVQWLYLPGEFNQPTPAPAGNITSVSFKTVGAGLGPWSYTDLTVKLGQSGITSLTVGEFYTGTLSTVYFSASASLSGTAEEWVTITLDSPFAYDPAQSLIVDVAQSGRPAGGFSVAQTSLSGTRRVWSEGGSPFVAYAGGDQSLCNLGLNIGTPSIGGGIKLSTNALAFTATYRGANPAARTLTMSNAGTNAFTYSSVITYSTGATNWLTVLPSAGTVALGGACVLTNTVNITGVSVGTHTATNRVTALGATNSPQEYVVTLTVVGGNPLDYDGDGKADLAVFDDVNGLWYVNSLANGTLAWGEQWGWAGAVSLPGDYDGDGKADLAVFDDVNGLWYVNSLANGTLAWGEQWGWSGAIPVPGDYDGDGKADLAVFDDANGLWYVNSLANGVFAWGGQWGWAGAVPVPGDYDGDGKADATVFDDVNGLWYVYSPANGTLAWGEQWGWAGAIPVSGDYDGDGQADLAVFDDVRGLWYINSLANGVIVWGEQWGWAGAVPVPGDYDGDGSADLAVFDDVNGLWYIRTVSGTTLVWATRWGWSGALPVSAR